MTRYNNKVRGKGVHKYLNKGEITGTRHTDYKEKRYKGASRQRSGKNIYTGTRIS